MLQDSVLLRVVNPQHPLWQHPVFNHPDYEAFAKAIVLSTVNAEEPEDLLLRRTIPIIAERLSSLQQGLSQEITKWGKCTDEGIHSLNNKVNDYFSGKVAIMLTAHQPPSSLIITDPSLPSNLYSSTTDNGFTSTIPLLPSISPLLPQYYMSRIL